MQSAIVVLVISFIWFYIGCFPFKYYIHELISFIHFMMNSFYSFMCTCILIIGYYWICIAMIDIIPYWCYPYVIPTFHVVIIHR